MLNINTIEKAAGATNANGPRTDTNGLNFLTKPVAAQASNSNCFATGDFIDGCRMSVGKTNETNDASIFVRCSLHLTGER